MFLLEGGAEFLGVGPVLVDDFVAVFEVEEDRLEAVVEDLAREAVELLSDRVGEDIVCGRAIDKLLKDVFEFVPVQLVDEAQRAAVLFELCS